MMSFPSESFETRASEHDRNALDPKELEKVVHEDHARWGRVIHQGNIKAD